MARTLRIGLNMFPADPFWVQVRETVIERARQLGLELIPINTDDYVPKRAGQPNDYLQSQPDDEQIALLEELLGQNLDAIVGWNFPEPLAYWMLEAGVPIIFDIETSIRHPRSVARVGHYQGAQLLGRYIADRLDRRGHVLVVGGQLRPHIADDGRSRIAGFRDVFELYSQIHWRHIPCPWEYDPAYAQIYTALQEITGSIDAILGLSDPLALAGRDAARDLGRLGPHTLIGGINGNPLTLAAIAEGSFTATVETSATDLGCQVLDLAHQAAQGLSLPAEFTCQTRLVTAENVAEVAAQKLMAIADLPSRLVGVQRHADQQRLTQLEISLEISRQVGAILDRWQLTQEIARLICANYGYDHAQIFLWDALEQRLVLDEAAAEPGQQISLALAEAGVLAQAVERNELIFVPDAQRGSRFPPDPRWPATRSRVVVPIQLGEQLIAVLDLHSARVTRQTRPELVGMQSLAAQLGIALRNAELYSQALDARAKAEVASQVKSTFLANMSHELRTPLNAILGYAHILQQRPLEAADLNRLSIIQRSGQHLLTLINDILDLSKVEAGKMELYPNPIQLSGFLEQITSIIRTRAEQKGLDFTYQTAGSLPAWVEADETRLRQVLLNLLGNAVKFTDHGTITLRVSSELETGTRSTHNSKLITQNRVRFEVEDTGVGIPPDQVERIFQPFEQAGEVLRRTEGTGLGLSISRQLVRLMGGELHVDSEPGQGSAFWFEIGLLVVAAVEGASASPAGRIIVGYKGPRRKILVADDIPSNRAVLVDLLTPLGFEIVEATNGQEAIELAQASQPDLIFMDWRMPVLSGLEAARQLRQIPTLQGVPIIGMSASVSEADRALSLEMGYHAFLPKPIPWPSLTALLETRLHLEWMFEEAESARIPLDAAKCDIIPPPAPELEMLSDLARIGDMRGIQQRATYLEKLDERLRPFADKLRQLARNFEDQAIQALLKHAMEDDQ